MTPNHAHPHSPLEPHGHGPAASHGHGPAASHGHGPASEDDDELAELLALDGLFARPFVTAAFDAVINALTVRPRVIVDLGAGTGSGTVALAGRFAEARVHALDASPGMIERVRASAVAAGVGVRVEAHLVDLDGDWPTVTTHPVDVAWAALSLHHTSDPERVLRQVFDVLRPGGVAIVTEFSGETGYQPADLGTGSAGVADRLVSALAARGYPVRADWASALEAAGFAPVTRHEALVHVSGRTREGARYLELHLGRNRNLFAEVRERGDLASDDLAALDTAIDAVRVGGTDLEYTSGRVFWVAVRPAAGPSGAHASATGVDR